MSPNSHSDSAPDSPSGTSGGSSLEALTSDVVSASRLSVFLGAASRAFLALSVAFAVAALVARSILGTDLFGPLGRTVRSGASPLLGAFLAILLALSLAACWGYARSRKDALRRAEAALWLDVRAGASGRVITASEVTDDSAAAWRTDATAVAMSARERPRVDVRGGWSRAAVAVLVLLASVLAPIRSRAAETDRRVAALFEEKLEGLSEKLEALDEEVALEEEDRAELEETLERLEQDASESPDLEATYEALDRMDRALESRAEEALAAAKEAMESLAADGVEDAGGMESMGLESGGAMPDPGEKLAQNISEAIEKAADLELSERLSEELAKELSQKLGLGVEGLEGLPGAMGQMSPEALSQLSPEELKALAKALENALAGSLEDLAKAGLLDPSALKNLKPASGLPKLTAEQLAMLEPCPECAKNPGGT